MTKVAVVFFTALCFPVCSWCISYKVTITGSKTFTYEVDGRRLEVDATAFTTQMYISTAITFLNTQASQITRLPTNQPTMGTIERVDVVRLISVASQQNNADTQPSFNHQYNNSTALIITFSNETQYVFMNLIFRYTNELPFLTVYNQQAIPRYIPNPSLKNGALIFTFSPSQAIPQTLDRSIIIPATTIGLGADRINIPGVGYGGYETLASTDNEENM